VGLFEEPGSKKPTRIIHARAAPFAHLQPGLQTSSR
jgi:hypothetical protein